MIVTRFSPTDIPGVWLGTPRFVLPESGSVLLVVLVLAVALLVTFSMLILSSGRRPHNSAAEGDRGGLPSIAGSRTRAAGEPAPQSPAASNPVWHVNGTDRCTVHDRQAIYCWLDLGSVRAGSECRLEAAG